MYKVSKRLTAALGGMILLLCVFSACGKTAEEPKPTPAATPLVWASPLPEAAEPTPTPEPTAAPEPTPEPTATPAPLTILYQDGQVNSITARTGAQLSLGVDVPDEDKTAMTFTSSNEKVATVTAEGVVTTMSEGTAEIVCAIGDRRGVCKVTVTKPVKPKVSICFLGTPKTDFTMNASNNETVQLTASVSPSDTGDPVVWSIDNPAVADVSPDGLVTALSEGSAQITCAVGEGKARCWVRVRGQRLSFQPATDNAADKTPRVVITFGGYIETDFTIAKGQSLDLEYKLYNTTGAVTWATRDPAVVSVDQNGTVTGLKAGSSTVLTATCGSLTAECTVRVSR